MLLRSQTAVMDQTSREMDEAYQARMLLLITEAKQWSDVVAAATKKKAEDAEKARLLAIEQQRQQDEPVATAADEERVQRREKIFSGERELFTMEADWRAEAENAASTSWGSDPSPPPMPALPTPPIASRHWRLTSDPSRATMDLIPWFCKFELKLQLHHVSEHKHHAYLYTRLGGAYQAWLDNLLSKYGVVAVELHTKISRDDLKAAWHKRFQVEPPKIKAMEKLMTFGQGTLPSVDWIAEYQRLTSVPDLQMGFKAIKHYFILRSCPALGNALTHVEDTLTRTAELFDKVVQIIVTNKEAKNLHRSSATGLSRDQHRPKVVVVAAAMPNDQTSEVVSANEGDKIAAARDGGRPDKDRGRGKTKTNTASSPGPDAAAPAPWSHYGLSEQVYKARTRFCYCLWCNSDLHETRYDDNNAPLLYVRIQVGQASCSALLDSGASRNFMSETFMQRVDLGTQVRRKANPAAIRLADGKTQQLIDRYIEAVPVYFAPHACEPVTFDILDTDFDVMLGMPWLASVDHTVNFHPQTLTVRDAFDAEVSCTIPLPHPSIRCQVVTAKSFRATCAYEQPNEIGLCFLRTVAVADTSPTDLSSDPRVVRLLDEFVDIFESPTGVVPDRPISHEIILEASVVLPKGCTYRMTEEELTVLRVQLDDLLDKGWIRASSSPYRAPVLFVRKKNKDLRLCMDYRKLNTQTVKNAGPLPRIDDLLARLGGVKYFSKLDLKSGYHQISIRPNDRYKSAFKMRYGHFEWAVMSVSLTNARATFQAAITNEFRAMLDRFVLVYLNDILVYNRTLEDHLGHLRRVLETLRRTKYKANRDKCEFVLQELEYLGHFVTPEGISPLSDKIESSKSGRNHGTSRMSVRSLAYYQRFIKGYSKIATHLTKLQCEDRSFDFGEDVRGSFLALKAALLFAEVLTRYCLHAEAITMNITGPFPKHKTCVDGILAVVNRLTKFAMFLPCCCHAKAPELVEVLYAGWIPTKGYPKEIVCDRDTEFMFDFWLALIKRWSLSLKPSSARHPQTDGQTKRAHQTAEVLLHTLVRPDQKDWVERLPDVELAFNSSIHPAIRMSPFEFEHGSPVTSPLDTIIPRTAESDDHLPFLRRMQELLVKARDQMAKTHQCMSQQANRPRLPRPFRAGDLVWVSAAEFSLEQDISCKLLPKWMGPWPIVAPIGDALEGPSFTIQVPAHLPVYPVFHCSKLALYTPAEHDDFLGRRSQDPPSMDGFQEVGDIISQRRYDNRPTEYLVHFAYCTHKLIVG
ncbi:hypothetical protein CBR_g23729 [Chara braunii]|uniref:Integrase catalytic domain-containing protein n=1 Tax=Chara braunii TaxID=69332 RepID=A0A388L573_CHABU|nr:hypothetical protein CBR_g23729 [Chara braunii]|eukprot:GBG77398.1 hypothetical protein CBR_g23729 [Chara braunii]